MSLAQIPVNGGHLYLRNEGFGDTVIFIHGWSLDHRAYEPQFEALKEDFNVLNFDRRGFGQSTAPPKLYRETEDILTIVDALNINQAHLVGMSQGGRIALRFAARYPDRTRSLTLQGTAADEIVIDELPTERIPLQTYANLVQQGRLSEVVDQWLAHPMMSSDGNSNVERALRTILADYSGEDLLRYDPHDYHWPLGLLDGLRSVQSPVQLMTGANDSQARRKTATQLLEVFENSREHIFQQAGHLCNLTVPEEFNAALIGFLHAIH